MKSKFMLLTLGFVGLAAQLSLAQISYTGTALSESFDSMGSTGTVAPAGWLTGSYTVVQNRVDPGSAPMSASLVPDDGANDAKAVSYNYGSVGSSDRAIGNIGTTSSGDRAIQVAITNNSGAAIPALQISYAGEQWRDFQGTSSSGVEQLQFFFSTAAGSGFVAYPALNFDAPQNGGLNAAINGNDPANRKTISGILTPSQPIGVGETFYLTWHDWNDNGTNDHGLAIDDVRVAAVPEPATIGLLGLGGLAWLYGRKRRQQIG